jgi:hypothetical protein
MALPSPALIHSYLAFYSSVCAAEVQFIEHGARNSYRHDGHWRCQHRTTVPNMPCHSHLSG